VRKYVFIGIGSFIGAVLRYFVRNIQTFDFQGKIPLSTLIINFVGAFVLALILTVAFEIWEFNPDVRLGLTTGLIGAFTTFSTVCKEAVGLINNGEYFFAISYIVLSAVLGLGAAYLGTVAAREIGNKFTAGKEQADQ
jgi:fluoride exporter